MDDMQEALRGAVSSVTQEWQTQQDQLQMTHGGVGNSQYGEDVRKTLAQHERERQQQIRDEMTGPQTAMANFPPLYAGAKALQGAAHSVGDWAGRANVALNGEFSPNPNITPENPAPEISNRRAPGRAMAPYLPDTRGVDQVVDPVTRAWGQGAQFAGSMAPEMAAGAAVGKTLGAVAGGVTKIPGASLRLKEIMEATKRSLSTFGGGQTPIPGGGVVANSAARAGGAMVSGGATGAALNPEDPITGAEQGAIWAQAGPILHGATRGASVANDMLNPNRAPLVAQEFLQKSLKPGAGQIREDLNLGVQGHPMSPILPRQPPQMTLDPAMANVNRFLQKEGPASYGQSQIDHAGAQGNKLRDDFARRTRGLQDDIDYRHEITNPGHERLARDNTKIDTNRRGFVDDSRSISDSYDDLMNSGTADAGTVLTENMRKLLGPDGRVRPEVRGGDIYNTTRGINETLRKGDLSDSAASALHRQRRAIQTNVIDPDLYPNSAQQRFAKAYEIHNRNYEMLSAPIDEKNLLNEVMTEGAHATKLLPEVNGVQRRAIDPAKFAKKVDKLEASPYVWNQLPPESQEALKTLRRELLENDATAKGGRGSKQGEQTVKENLPWFLRDKPRTLTEVGWGWVNPATTAKLTAGRMGADAQRGKVLKEASDIVLSPTKLQQVIDDAVRNKPRAHDVSDLTGYLGGIFGPSYSRERDQTEDDGTIYVRGRRD